MGATNCPETPRQKMIQMMYLVYTALLALNVSAEVVSGFVTVGDAMSKSNENIEIKLNDTYSLFADANKNNPEKTQEWYDKALEVKKITEELKSEIDSLQYEFLCFIQPDATVIDHSNENAKPRKIPLRDENKNPLLDSARVALELGGLSVILKKDDNNMGSEFFYGSNEPPTGKSIHLRDAVLKYKQKLKNILGEDSTILQMDLNVDQEHWSDHAKAFVPWEQFNFDNTIAIADMVVLTRLKAEAMNAEFDAVNILFKKVKQGDFSFDQVAVIVRPKSSYIIQGGTYEADINIAAYDSKAHFEAEIGGGRQLSNDSGCVNVRRQCGTPGEQTISGTVYVKNDNGPAKEYRFSEKYFVAEPAAIVSLTKMKVLYYGIDNPMSVSVPGVDSRYITPTIKETGAATIVKDPKGKAGDYIIKPTKQNGRIHIVTYAKTDGKTNRIMGEEEYRIKKIPDPVVKIENYDSKKPIKLNILKNSRGIQVKYPDDFDFELAKPKVLSYSFYLSRSNTRDLEGKGSGNWTPEMKSILKKKARVGGKLYIEDIQVKMADGTTRSIGGVSFRIN